MTSTITQHTTPAIGARQGDQGTDTTLYLESLALEGQRLRREAGEKVGPFMYVFRLPGHTVEQRTTVGTRSSSLEIIENKFGAYLKRFGMTVEDLFKPNCPIKFACAYTTRDGNVVTEGNWPEMTTGLVKMLGILTATLMGDEDTDLEIITR